MSITEDNGNPSPLLLLPASLGSQGGYDDESFSLWENIPAHTDGSTVETSSMCEPYGKHTDSEESILQSARTCMGTGSKPGAGFVLTSVNAHRLFRCL